MRSDYLCRDDLGHLYALLTPANALVLRVGVETGLRIGDILAIRTEQLQKDRFTIREHKTKKTRRVRLSEGLRRDLLHQAGRIYVFEHRIDPERHRTRQAVYADMRRAARALRLHCVASPHSLRKYYAVERLRETGDLRIVQRDLQHDRIETTLIYALADRLDLLKSLSLQDR